MDYSTLAQLSSPGASPIKASGRYDVADPVAYARWLSMSRMQEESLKNALPLAAQNAQMQQQKTQEYMAGAPGRMDEINLSNMKAKAGVGNFDRDQSFEEAKKTLADAKVRAEIEDVTQDIAGDADAYRAAHERGDERLKNQILQKNHGRKLRNGYVVGSNPNKDEVLFRIAGEARANEPKLASKEKVAETNANAKITTTGMNNMTQVQIAQLRAEVSRQVSEINAKARTNKPLSATEQALLSHYGDGKTITDPEGLLKYNLVNRAAGVTPGLNQKSEAATSVLSGGGVNIPPAQAAEVPVSNKPPVTPPVNKQTVQSLSSEEFNNIKPGTSTWNKGNKVVKVVRKLYNAATKEFKLEFDDGSSIQEKVK